MGCPAGGVLLGAPRVEKGPNRFLPGGDSAGGSVLRGGKRLLLALTGQQLLGKPVFCGKRIGTSAAPHFMALGRDSGGLGHMGDPSRKRSSPAGIAPLRMPEHFCSPGLCCDLDISECEDPVSGVCPALFSWHFLLPAGNGGNSL